MAGRCGASAALVVSGLVASLAAACTAGSGQAGPDVERTTSPSTSRTTSASTGQPFPPTTPTGSETPVSPVPLTDAEQQRLDTRLVDAAWRNDVTRARGLIERGADVNAQDETQQSAFLIATSEGFYDLLDLTLRNGARPDAKDSFDGTGLIRAAERGHHDVVGRLVRAGTELDHVNNLGWTALHEAVILGDGGRRYVDTVRVLVAAGADLGIPARRDGMTALEHARSKGYDAIADVQAAATEAGRPGRATAERRLLEAAAAGEPDDVAIALRAGARLEARDDARRTPLLLAVTHDRLAVARLLVALGADPDALDDRHDTPWLVTGVTGSVPMVEVLLPARPDLTIRNRFGGVSIIPASERGHVDYVRRVARTGIDVNHVNDLGWTALLEAVILGDGSTAYQEIVRILLDAGADPAIADSDGVTALEHAETRGQDEVVRILRRAT